MSEQSKLATVQLNTRGLRCPEPVMMLHQAIRRAKSGDIVGVCNRSFHLMGYSKVLYASWT